MLRILLIFIFFANCIFPDHQSMAEVLSSAASSSSTLKNLSVLDQLKQLKLSDVTLSKIKEGKNKDSLLILIRDLHCQEEAQINIAKTLEVFQKELGLKNVFMEGAEGEFDLELLKAFPEDKVRGKVGLQFLKEGYLTGAEYAALRSGLQNSLDLYGIEESKLYIENLQAFLKVRRLAKELSSEINKIDEQIKNIIEKTYIHEMKELLNLQNQLKEGELKLDEALIQLDVLLQKNGQKLDGHLKEMLEILKTAKAIQSKTIQSDLKKLLDELSHRLKNEELKEMVKWSLEYRLGRMGILEYLTHLKEAYEKNGLSLEENYPGLSHYYKLQLHQEDLKSESIYEELEQKINTLMLELSKAHNVIQEERMVREWGLIKDLIALKATRKGLEKVKEINIKNFILELNERLKNGFPIQAFGNDRKFEGLSSPSVSVGDPYKDNVIARRPRADVAIQLNDALSQIASSQLKTSGLAMTSSLASLLNESLHFYDLALARDQVMAENALKQIEARSRRQEARSIEEQVFLRNTNYEIRTTVLVTGGFHTEGIERILDEKGISYAVVIPNMQGKVDESIYEKGMQGPYDFEQTEFSQKKLAAHEKTEDGRWTLTPAVLYGGILKRFAAGRYEQTDADLLVQIWMNVQGNIKDALDQWAGALEKLSLEQVTNLIESLKKAHPDTIVTQFFSELEELRETTGDAAEITEALIKRYGENQPGLVVLAKAWVKKQPKPTEGIIAEFQKQNRGLREWLVRYAAEYQGHIQRSRDLILEGAQGLSGTALLLGLGNGMEYTPEGLEKLANQFERIVVVDIDEEGVRTTLRELDQYLVEKGRSPLSQKFVVRVEDLSGVLADFSIRVEEIVKTSALPEYAVAQLIKLIQSLEIRNIDLSSYQASYVVSSLVMTQLASFIYQYSHNLFSKKFGPNILNNHSFLAALNRLATELPSRHIQQLARWVQPQGRVYLSDTLAEIRMQRYWTGQILQGNPMVMLGTDILEREVEKKFDYQVRPWIDGKTFWEWERVPVGTSTGSQGSKFVVGAMVLKPKNIQSKSATAKPIGSKMKKIEFEAKVKEKGIEKFPVMENATSLAQSLVLGKQAQTPQFKAAFPDFERDVVLVQRLMRGENVQEVLAELSRQSERPLPAQRIEFHTIPESEIIRDEQGLPIRAGSYIDSGTLHVFVTSGNAIGAFHEIYEMLILPLDASLPKDNPNNIYHTLAALAETGFEDEFVSRRFKEQVQAMSPEVVRSFIEAYDQAKKEIAQKFPDEKDPKRVYALAHAEALHSLVKEKLSPATTAKKDSKVFFANRGSIGCLVAIFAIAAACISLSLMFMGSPNTPPPQLRAPPTAANAFAHMRDAAPDVIRLSSRRPRTPEELNELVKHLLWHGESSFRFQVGDKTVYIDPYWLSDSESSHPADIIFITHSHYDHFNPRQYLPLISRPNTIFVAPQDVADRLRAAGAPNVVHVVRPGDHLEIEGIKIKAVPAYTTNPDPIANTHPRENNWVGYVIETPDGRRLYHAGDTDFIPEMRDLSNDNLDIALLPVGGHGFTMDAQQAAEAAAVIRPVVAVPMHYSTEVVTAQEEAAGEFANRLRGSSIPVRILIPWFDRPEDIERFQRALGSEDPTVILRQTPQGVTRDAGIRQDRSRMQKGKGEVIKEDVNLEPRKNARPSAIQRSSIKSNVAALAIAVATALSAPLIAQAQPVPPTVTAPAAERLQPVEMPTTSEEETLQSVQETTVSQTQISDLPPIGSGRFSLPVGRLTPPASESEASATSTITPTLTPAQERRFTYRFSGSLSFPNEAPDIDPLTRTFIGPRPVDPQVNLREATANVRIWDGLFNGHMPIYAGLTWQNIPYRHRGNIRTLSWAVVNLGASFWGNLIDRPSDRLSIASDLRLLGSLTPGGYFAPGADIQANMTYESPHTAAALRLGGRIVGLPTSDFGGRAGVIYPYSSLSAPRSDIPTDRFVLSGLYTNFHFNVAALRAALPESAPVRVWSGMRVSLVDIPYETLDWRVVVGLTSTWGLSAWGYAGKRIYVYRPPSGGIPESSIYGGSITWVPSDLPVLIGAAYRYATPPNEPLFTVFPNQHEVTARAAVGIWNGVSLTFSCAYAEQVAGFYTGVSTCILGRSDSPNRGFRSTDPIGRNLPTLTRPVSGPLAFDAMEGGVMQKGGEREGEVEIKSDETRSAEPVKSVEAGKGVLIPVYKITDALVSPLNVLLMKPISQDTKEDFIVPVIEEGLLMLTFLLGPWAYVAARILFVALHAFQDHAPLEGRKRTLFEKILIPSIISTIGIVACLVAPLIFSASLIPWAIFLSGLVMHIASNRYVTLTGSKLQKGVIQADYDHLLSDDGGIRDALVNGEFACVGIVTKVEKRGKPSRELAQIDLYYNTQLSDTQGNIRKVGPIKVQEQKIQISPAHLKVLDDAIKDLEIEFHLENTKIIFIKGQRAHYSVERNQIFLNLELLENPSELRKFLFHVAVERSDIHMGLDGPSMRELKKLFQGTPQQREEWLLNTRFGIGNSSIPRSSRLTDEITILAQASHERLLAPSNEMNQIIEENVELLLSDEFYRLYQACSRDADQFGRFRVNIMMDPSGKMILSDPDDRNAARIWRIGWRWVGLQFFMRSRGTVGMAFSNHIFIPFRRGAQVNTGILRRTNRLDTTPQQMDRDLLNHQQWQVLQETLDRVNKPEKPCYWEMEFSDRLVFGILTRLAVIQESTKGNLPLSQVRQVMRQVILENLEESDYPFSFRILDLIEPRLLSAIPEYCEDETKMELTRELRRCVLGFIPIRDDVESDESFISKEIQNAKEYGEYEQLLFAMIEKWGSSGLYWRDIRSWRKSLNSLNLSPEDRQAILLLMTDIVQKMDREDVLIFFKKGFFDLLRLFSNTDGEGRRKLEIETCGEYIEELRKITNSDSTVFSCLYYIMKALEGKDSKTLETTKKEIVRILALDWNKRMPPLRALLKQLSPIDYESYLNRKGTQPINTAGAVTITGEELSAVQHEAVNTTIREAFISEVQRAITSEELKDLDPDGFIQANNVSVYEISSLSQFDGFLVAHPGRGGEAFNHQLRQIYLSPVQVQFIRSLSREAKREFWEHEIGHIVMANETNGEATEDEVQERYPVNLVLKNALVEKLLSEMRQRNLITEANSKKIQKLLTSITDLKRFTNRESIETLKTLLKWVQSGKLNTDTVVIALEVALYSSEKFKKRLRALNDIMINMHKQGDSEKELENRVVGEISNFFSLASLWIENTKVVGENISYILVHIMELSDYAGNENRRRFVFETALNWFESENVTFANVPKVILVIRHLETSFQISSSAEADEFKTLVREIRTDWLDSPDTTPENAVSRLKEVVAAIPTVADDFLSEILAPGFNGMFNTLAGKESKVVTIRKRLALLKARRTPLSLDDDNFSQGVISDQTVGKTLSETLTKVKATRETQVVGKTVSVMFNKLGELAKKGEETSSLDQALKHYTMTDAYRDLDRTVKKALENMRLLALGDQAFVSLGDSKKNESHYEEIHGITSMDSSSGTSALSETKVRNHGHTSMELLDGISFAHMGYQGKAMERNTESILLPSIYIGRDTLEYLAKERPELLNILLRIEVERHRWRKNNGYKKDPRTTQQVAKAAEVTALELEELNKALAKALAIQLLNIKKLDVTQLAETVEAASRETEGRPRRMVMNGHDIGMLNHYWVEAVAEVLAERLQALEDVEEAERVRKAHFEIKGIQKNLQDRTIASLAQIIWSKLDDESESIELNMSNGEVKIFQEMTTSGSVIPNTPVPVTTDQRQLICQMITRFSYWNSVLINLKGENIRSQEDLKKVLEKYLLPPASQGQHEMGNQRHAQEYAEMMA